ncbi:SCO family protein [Pseudomonas sp. NPDC078700]|uniref:SCO family protein n=1 Tax=Pseudomonas sp. NPDC078700 TaxID=3364424 RepID=UPI0037CB9B74
MHRLTQVNIGSLIALSLSVSFGPVQAMDDHAQHNMDEHAQHMTQQSTVMKQESARVTFADVQLVNQDGKSVRLEPDLVADKIVLMGFIYTSCTTVCPVVSAIMKKTEVQLQANAGPPVQLISISVDPLRDTPEQLRRYAQSYMGAGDAWSWLTGKPQAITDTLKQLGAWSPDLKEHPALIMIGDGRSGQWTRFYGFSDPNILVAKIQEIQLSRAKYEAQHIAGHEGSQQ